MNETLAQGFCPIEREEKLCSVKPREKKRDFRLRGGARRDAKGLGIL